MSDLAEFLLARIDEDEDTVRQCLKAIDADRTEYAQQVLRRTGPLCTVTSASHCGQDMGPRGTVEATPGRALAECEVKRRIVEQLWLYVARPDPTSSDPSGTQALWIVKMLALPYADHPDYREEWRP